MVYIVTYDLRKKGKDYIGLFEQLKNSPQWAHYLESTWFIQTSEKPADLYKRLSAHLDKGDSMIIIEFKGSYHGVLPENAWKWIDKYTKS